MLRSNRPWTSRSALAALRRTLAVAWLGCNGVAFAASVSFNETALDSIFRQSTFGTMYTIDIRFNDALSVVAQTLVSIDSDPEFSKFTFSNPASALSDLVQQLSIPTNTVAMFYVDKINYCGGSGANIIGCGSIPGRLIALDSNAAAEVSGAALIAHELGHNLGLSHDDTIIDGNLMNSRIYGDTTLTTDQIDTFLDRSNGNSRNPIVQIDSFGNLYIAITPIAVLAAAPVPEPQTWAMWSLGLLGVAGWARHRRTWAG